MRRSEPLDPARQRPQEYYRGYPMVKSDLLKEFFAVLLAILLLTVALAVIFSSPDEGVITIRRTAQDNPLSFAQNTLGYLDGSSDLSTYGPPYNNGTGSLQSFGSFSPQKWAGVAVRIDPSHDFVLAPLQVAAQDNPQLTSALKTYASATADQRLKWETNLENALAAKDARVVAGTIQVGAGDYGPVLQMIDAELQLGLSGALDGLLSSQGGTFYQANATRQLLFISSSETLDNLATHFNLQGNQWGVMNETGNWPGQAWLWLYTTLYQIPPFTTSWASSADLAAMLTMGALSLVLLLVPWIPGLRDVPRLVPLYRIIWREHYQRLEKAPKPPGASRDAV